MPRAIPKRPRPETTEHKILCEFDVALITHRGRIRASNEDAVAVNDVLFTGDMRVAWSKRLGAGPHTLLIADGMGGHAGGQLASRSVVEFISRRTDCLDNEEMCEQALHAANEFIYEQMNAPECIEMGTTLVGLALREQAVIHFNVGDSRAYRFGQSGLVRLSIDDRLRSDNESCASHVITQAIGGSLIPLGIVPHLGTTSSLGHGESLLLCSDGLSDMMGDDAIATILGESESPNSAVESLFAEAMTAGGRDNVSILVVRPRARKPTAERASGPIHSHPKTQKVMRRNLK